MKASRVLCGALVALVSASAYAQSVAKTEAERDQANLNAHENYPVVKFEGTRTRADVIAELEAARLGKPVQPSSVKPSAAGSPAQSKAADASLYNGA